MLGRWPCMAMMYWLTPTGKLGSLGYVVMGMYLLQDLPIIDSHSILHVGSLLTNQYWTYAIVGDVSEPNQNCSCPKFNTLKIIPQPNWYVSCSRTLLTWIVIFLFFMSSLYFLSFSVLLSVLVLNNFDFSSFSRFLPSQEMKLMLIAMSVIKFFGLVLYICCGK